jgi:maleylpyruvate isomerase
MVLYDYFRSSAAFRVRIALNLKGLRPERHFVHLRKGDQHAAAYRTLNPQGLIPMLVVGETRLTQSLAIVEYLDETHPTPPLLPEDVADRAWVRSIALAIACDIHPIDNLRVLKHLGRVFQADEKARNEWYEHWIREGFNALEVQLAERATGRYCLGEAPTLADVFLVPQVANALRSNIALDPWPRIRAINEACLEIPAVADAQPARQPDAE